MNYFLNQFTIFAESAAIQEAQLKEAEWYVNVIVMIGFLPIAIFAVLSMMIVRPWRKAVRLNLDLTVPDLIGLKLRRVPTDLVFDALVLAMQNEVELTCFDVKYAYLEGVDVEKAVKLLVKLHREDDRVTFDQVVQQLNQGDGHTPEDKVSEESFPK